MKAPPLAGITVVSIEQAVAAPFATRQLADLGARVIKIERPDGGDFARGYDTSVKGLSSYFVWLNRSKESLALDLKHPDAAEVLARLLDRADVVVQNLAPGAAERLGTEPAALRARDPRLIVCTVSGYGTAGPYKDRKAYDLLVQNEVGLISITGTEASPSKVGISVADIAAGMYVYSGILAALFARTTTGEGTTVEVSLFDALAEWMSAPAYYTRYGGSAPRRTGDAHATIAPYERFVTGDGMELSIAIQNNREWSRLCEQVLNRQDLVDDLRFRLNPARVQHRAALHDLVAAALAQWPGAEVVRRLDRAGVAYAHLNSMSDFLQHDQLLARDRWRAVSTPAGTVDMLLPPVQTTGVDPVMAGVPSLGQHTGAILSELGFGQAAIAAWRQGRMIA